MSCQFRGTEIRRIQTYPSSRTPRQRNHKLRRRDELPAKIRTNQCSAVMPLRRDYSGESPRYISNCPNGHSTGMFGGKAATPLAACLFAATEASAAGRAGSKSVVVRGNEPRHLDKLRWFPALIIGARLRNFAEHPRSRFRRVGAMPA